jgi:hypothetical protein
MYSLINDNCDAVLNELERKLDVSAYQNLQRRLQEVNVAADKDFQRKYRVYWRMNVARLGEDFYRRYFGLLEDSKTTGSPNVAFVVQHLSVKSNSTERQSIQFSFASKLVHTLDPRAPVYDSLVTAFYFFVPTSSRDKPGKKLDQLLEFYSFLRAEYERVIRLGLLDTAVHRFRERIQLQERLCDERVIDFLIWGFVKLLQGAIQQKGQCLYA